MVKLPSSLISAVLCAPSGRALRTPLQGALELEYRFIPVYLTALFSLRDGCNGEIRDTLYDLVVQRMLHVALIANTLNAMGYSPDLSGRRLGHALPGELPLQAAGVDLNRRKFSPQFLWEIGASAAESRTPRAKPSSSFDASNRRGTLSDFYAAAAAAIERLGDAAFHGDPRRQFVDAVSYSEHELFPVIDKASAIRALGRMVAQNGATSLSPSSTAWSAPFNPAGVINIIRNSVSEMYPPRSPVRSAIDEFNIAYSVLLTALHETFNGQPERYELAVSNMYRLSSLSRLIVSFDLGDDTFAAPAFEWTE